MYTPDEIARAAGVPAARVVAALDGEWRFVAYSEAVALGRLLARPALFSTFDIERSVRPASVPLAVSGSLHVGIIVATILMLALGPEPVATTLNPEERPAEDVRLVFLNLSGPGGGGGGGGALQIARPPKMLRQGRRAKSDLIPAPPPAVVESVKETPTPAEPIHAESLPIQYTPLPAARDDRDRGGLIQRARGETESRGPGREGGVGSGAGTGNGEGQGSGVGPGSGGGIGGGPYRPGSGIEPPRLLREVKADYTDEARRNRVMGSVVLEIVVRRDGSVGDVTLLKKLEPGLDDRAVQAVRQWRFAPATRQGVPVDVIVEVAVDFKLR